MFTYRITEVDSHVIVGTEDEAVMVCSSLKMARRVVSDARLLETSTAGQIFSRRVLNTAEE